MSKRIRSKMIDAALGALILFPVSHSHSIHLNATDSELAIPRGLAHNAIYLDPTLAYWQPIIDFIDRIIR